MDKKNFFNSVEIKGREIPMISDEDKNLTTNQLDLDYEEDDEVIENRIDESFYLNLELDLPDNSNDLSKVTKLIDKTRERIMNPTFRLGLDDKRYFDCYNKIIDYLEFVGQLSIPVFQVEDKIEFAYTIKYKNDPLFAKKLWYQHYSDLHKQYTIQKNKCFRLLTALDKRYEKIYGYLPKFNEDEKM